MRIPKPLLLCAALAATMASPHADAVFVNGGFEQNSFAGWTLGGGSNPGLIGAEPFTLASIPAVSLGATPGPASIVGNITDPRAPLLTLPRVGGFTAKVNDEAGGARTTTLTQADAITAVDIDAADGLPHIRFSFAPVLEDPLHSPNQQPYFYVVMKRVSDGAILFEQFAYSGQAGVPFQIGSGSWKYLPFQNVDVTLAAGDVGETVELMVVAADCSPTAHGGYVYVDGFGSAVVPPPSGATDAPVFIPSADRVGLGLLAGLLLVMAGVVLRRGNA
ncbi:MAG: hypothetical protein WCZ65_07545 [Lysobacteraceae bacterium]|jgi:hypothetical protein